MSAERRSWSKGEVFELISRWELSPELWDAKHKWYHNRGRKQAALQRLAADFGTRVDEINRKLHNLRTQFHSEVRKARARRGDDRRSAWDFFDAVKFISCESADVVADSPPPPPTRVKNRARRGDRPSECDRPSKSTDEFQIFGDYVASELRNLTSVENRRKLKLDIQRAIIRASEVDIVDFSTPHSSFSLCTTPNSAASNLSDFAAFEEKPRIAPDGDRESYFKTETSECGDSGPPES